MTTSFYSFEEFLKVCASMHFCTASDYLNRYKQDKKLPSNPYITYKEEWIKAGRWSCITTTVETESKNLYTLLEFIRACRSLNIRTQKIYKGNIKLIKEKFPRFPYAPDIYYGKEWNERGKWDCIKFGKKPKNIYPFGEFVEVCLKMKIKNLPDYKRRYRDDPRLPSSPSLIYGEKWKAKGGWIFFSERFPKFVVER